MLKNTHLRYIGKARLETLLWSEAPDGTFVQHAIVAPFSPKALQLVYTCPECRHKMGCTAGTHAKQPSLPFPEMLRNFIEMHFTRVPQQVYKEHLSSAGCPCCGSVDLAPTDKAFFDHACPQTRIQCHVGTRSCGKMIACGSHAAVWEHLKQEHSWECPSAPSTCRALRRSSCTWRRTTSCTG